ncbi:hypothetical protein [Phormidium sp. CCY1219]|uniref:hypothetical protein n=1 Tax=Phormidium sp. CCY1219 TaxID=2886104 RepID=UPI002D764AF0|nr:hypothetical protein [Phormidium sp. CCY1219]
MSFFTYKPNIGAAIFARGASVTAIMGSHDVDEAVLLSDRIVMLTNGPGANIGPVLDVDIPRPHKPIDVVEHPSYYSLRWEIIYLLNQYKRIEKIWSLKSAAIARHALENLYLDVGFGPLTACAPIAKESRLLHQL